MKIIHKFGNLSSFDKTAYEELTTNYSDLKINVSPFSLFFFVDSEDSRCPELFHFAKKYEFIQLFSATTFTKEELATADWLQIDPMGHHGYPQPEDTYDELTYDATDSGYCKECCMGAVQKAPFMMRKEPNWGRRSVIQMNWVFDEYFVTPEVWKSVFQSFGIESMPVLHHKTKEPLQTVVQLVIKDTLPGGILIPSEHKFEICPACKRKRFNPAFDGYFPPFEKKPDATIHAVKSQEYFGSGHKSFKRIFFSQDLYQAIQKAGLKGLSFSAVAKDF